MKQDVVDVINIWRQSYSTAVKEKKNYQSIDQLRKFASLFSPGKTYFYILNFHNLEFEYISEEVEEITGFKQYEVNMKDLLSIILDLSTIQKKEQITQDFAINHIEGKELLNYKFIYSYKIKDLKGKQKTILLQNIALTLTDTGGPQHVLGMHTDITHLKIIGNSKDLSIVNVKGGTSYFNLNLDEGKFNPVSANNKEELPSLTKREKEIARLLAKGLDSNKIAEEIFISPHTVRKHRKNMLKKLDCVNVAELVAQCLATGVIDPS